MAKTGQKAVRGSFRLLARVPQMMPATIRDRVMGARPHRASADIAPDTQIVLGLLDRLSRASSSSLSIEQIREASNKRVAMLGGSRRSARESAIVIPGPAGDISARVYEPFGRRQGILVWFHGGGFQIGGLDMAEPTARAWTHNLPLVVVTIGYRMAPENPFPAAAEDALCAYQAVVERAAEWGVSADKVFVGGDSAGGNLALSVALQMRDLRRAGDTDLPPPALQVAVYPVTNMSDWYSSYEEFTLGYLLSTDVMVEFGEGYLPDPKQRLNPYASVAKAADHRDLGPAVIVASGCDPLRDNAREYAQLLEESGSEVTLLEEPQQSHAFLSFADVIPSAKQAFLRLQDAVRPYCL